MLQAILFGMLDILALVIAIFLVAKGKVGIVAGALLALSLSFTPHALASLVYSEPGSVNPMVVYDTLPFLRKWHTVLGALPVLMLLYAGVTSANRQALQSPAAIAYVISIVILSLSYFSRETALTAEFASIMASFFVGLMMFLAFVSHRQQTDRDVTALRYFVWIAALSVAVSVLEIALTKVRAATIYAVADPENTILSAYRASGLFNNPNWQGNWCALLILCCAWCIQQNREKQWAYLGIVLGVLGIYLTGSRGAFAAAGGALLVFLVLSARHYFRSSIAIALTTVVSAIVVDLFGVVANALLPTWPFAQNMFGLHYRWFSQTISLLLAVIGSLFHVTLVDIASPASESAIGRISSAEGSDNGLAPIAALGSFAAYSLVPIVLVLLWALLWVWRSPNRRQLLPLTMGAVAFAILLPMQLRAFSVFPIWVFEAATIAVVLAIGFRGHLEAGPAARLVKATTAKL
ncbi:hypothetical protein [Devosia sp.]|uniref:hypothetical protein n=1 Tax=Devosia sp. TaxID=1871048 RepID=UPI00326503EB